MLPPTALVFGLSAAKLNSQVLKFTSNLPKKTPKEFCAYECTFIKLMVCFKTAFNPSFTVNSCLERQTNMHSLLRSLERNTQLGVIGRKGYPRWPESWPATPPLPAAPAQRSPLAIHIGKKSPAENESAPSSQRRRLPSILHDHSVIHEYYLRNGKSFL